MSLQRNKIVLLLLLIGFGGKLAIAMESSASSSSVLDLVNPVDVTVSIEKLSRESSSSTSMDNAHAVLLQKMLALESKFNDLSIENRTLKNKVGILKRTVPLFIVTHVVHLSLAIMLGSGLVYVALSPEVKTIMGFGALSIAALYGVGFGLYGMTIGVGDLKDD